MYKGVVRSLTPNRNFEQVKPFIKSLSKLLRQKMGDTTNKEGHKDQATKEISVHLVQPQRIAIFR